MGSDDEEWYPPTPPPYDVADKLVEANSRLEADPNSTERIADKIKWRSESSLVEIRQDKSLWGSRSRCTLRQFAISRWMDDDTFPPNGVAKNGREIVIVDDLTPHITAAKSSCNGHATNGFHPSSSASPSLEDEDGEDDGQEGAIPYNGGEFLTESSVDEECADDVSEEHDDCAIVEEVSSARNGRVAPSACTGTGPARPNAAEIRQEPLQPSPFSSPQAELPAPPIARPASPPPFQTGSNQKVLPAAKESVPNGQPNRRKHPRPNSSSLSSDCAASGDKGRGAAVANPSRAQGVVKAPDCAVAGGGGVCRSRSEDRLPRGAPPPSAKLTRRANSGCNGLQSNGSGVRAGVIVGAKSRSQSVDHERVRVERIPGERYHVFGYCITYVMHSISLNPCKE